MQVAALQVGDASPEILEDMRLMGGMHTLLNAKSYRKFTLCSYVEVSQSLPIVYRKVPGGLTFGPIGGVAGQQL